MTMSLRWKNPEIQDENVMMLQDKENMQEKSRSIIEHFTFSRRFYPKRLTFLFSGYTFAFIQAIKKFFVSILLQIPLT